MTTVIEAVFENGAFKPLSEVNLKEHQRYSLIIEELPQDDADIGDMLAEALAEVRRERNAHFDAEWPELVTTDDEK
ncbi:MAG: antitoxin family protein [Blastocatellia bacterium]